MTDFQKDKSNPALLLITNDFWELLKSQSNYLFFIFPPTLMYLQSHILDEKGMGATFKQNGKK